MKLFNSSRYRQSYWSALIVGGILVLQGCASTTAFSDGKAEKAWTMNGKIGMVYPEANCVGNDCRMRSDQGSIRWQQQKTHYEIVLSDPFGRELLQLAGDNRQLTASAPGKQRISASPDEFARLLTNQKTQQQAFADVTPADLSHWITGRANPQHPVQESGNGFEQKGFHINPSQWRDTNVGKMPSLVVVKKGQITLRIVIKAWGNLAKR